MNPRIAPKGASFKGLHKYLSHDPKAQTADRVAHITIRNCASTEHDRAVQEMIWTAQSRDRLKSAAGVRKAGNDNGQTVYHYALTWSPDEKPSVDHQVSCADETLKRLGLEEHQAIYYVHTDKDHAHIHIMVNRVHPQTGRYARHAKDKLILSDWALEYTEARGQSYSPQRKINQAERQKGQWVKHRAETRAAHYAWKKQLTAKIWNDYRAQRDMAETDKKIALDALWKSKQRRVDMVKAEVKDRFKPIWSNSFKNIRKAMRRYDRSVLTRLRAAADQSPTGRIGLLGFLRAYVNDGVYRQAYETKLKAEAAATIGKAHREAIKTLSDPIYAEWREQTTALRTQHKDAGKDRLDRARSASDQVWKAPPPANDKQDQQPWQEKTREEKIRSRVRSSIERRKRSRSRGRDP